MIEQSVLVFSIIALILIGTDRLILGGGGIARKKGFSPFGVGIVIAAAVTSLPELFLAVRFALLDQPDPGISIAIKSNIANIGLAFGAALMIGNVKSLPDPMFQMVTAFLAVIVLSVSLFLDSYLSRIDGFVLITGYPIMLMWLFRVLSEGPIHSEYDAKFGADFSIGSSLLNLGVGTAIYIFALGLFEWGTEVIWSPALGAADFSDAVFMPLLTSLPELMVCVVSALHRQYDFAAGVIIGASVTNLSIVVGVVAILKPSAVSAGSLSIHFLVMSVFAGVLLAMIYEPGAGEVKIRKVEGLMLMLAFFAYFAQVLYFA